MKPRTRLSLFVIAITIILIGASLNQKDIGRLITVIGVILCVLCEIRLGFLFYKRFIKREYDKS